MAESRDHKRLVACLVRRMMEQSITVTAAQAPGWPPPPWIGRRRPDVFGYYRTGGAVVAGEAKRGPELWDCRQQIEELATALPLSGPSGADALLILGVMPGWETEAADFCATLSLLRTAPIVWSPAIGRPQAAVRPPIQHQ
jgi:hypothetical protein